MPYTKNASSVDRATSLTPTSAATVAAGATAPNGQVPGISQSDDDTVRKAAELEKLRAEICKLGKEAKRLDQDIARDRWKVVAPYIAAFISMISVLVLVSNAVVDSMKTQTQRRYEVAQREMTRESDRMAQIIGEYKNLVASTDAVYTLFQAATIKHSTSLDNLDKARVKIVSSHASEKEKDVIRGLINSASRTMQDQTTDRAVLEQAAKARSAWQQRAGTLCLDFATYFPSSQDGGSADYDSDWKALQQAALDFLSTTLVAIARENRTTFTDRYTAFHAKADLFARNLATQHQRYRTRTAAQAVNGQLPHL